MAVKNPTTSGQTSMTLARNIIYYAISRGVSQQQLLEKLHLREADLNNPYATIDLATAIRLWTTVVFETRDLNFGLHLGEKSDPAVLGIVGHLYQSCPNLMEGMLNLQRFNPLFGSLIKLSIVEQADEIGICFSCSEEIKNLPLVRRQATDAWMSAVVSIFAKVGAGTPLPVRVGLTPMATTNLSAYEQIFKQAQIQWNAEENMIWYARSAMQMPLITSNPDIYAYFMRMAQDQLEALMGARSTSKTVQDLLIERFKNGFPGIEQLADELHTTARTLQRRLKAEGYTFTQLIEQAKQEMAFRLLRSRKYNISEVAYMLGFSEPGSFTRSFRKWTGKSPRAFFTSQAA
jgi:AraC-like DNA-binding protein